MKADNWLIALAVLILLTISGCLPPAGPGNLVAEPGDGQVNLSWNRVAGATTYEVFASTTPNAEATTPVQAGLTVTSTEITGLTNGTTYYFVVKARNAKGLGLPSAEVGATPIAPTQTAGSATLQDAVQVIASTVADWVASVDGNDWTLRVASNSLAAGDVILLEDDAVKIVAVRQEAGATIVTVEPAEIEDVFTELTLTQSVNLDDATFEPEPGSDAEIVNTLSAESLLSARSFNAAAVAIGADHAVRFGFNRPPFSGSADLTLEGVFTFNYDEDDDAGATGGLELTGIVDAGVLVSLGDSGSASLPEFTVGTIRIPVPYNIVDRALNVIGVRIAAIYIVVKGGADAEAGYSVALRVAGHAESNVSVSYTGEAGFVTHGPSQSASFSLNGELPGTGPVAVARANVSAGPYTRVKPQLLILNKVASLGADLKFGLYGDGQISAYLEDPFYCLMLQAKLKGEASAFFRAVGLGQLTSPALRGTLDVGEPYTRGDCRAESAITIESPLEGEVLSLDDGTYTATVHVAPAVSNENASVPTGQVTFTFQGNECVAMLNQGSASCDIEISEEGEAQELKVAFAGDTIYRPMEATVIVDVASSQNSIRLISGSCTPTAEGYQSVQLSGTATGQVGALVSATPNQTIGNPAGFSHSCSAWTGVVNYFGYTYCRRLANDPATTSWTTTSLGYNHTSVVAQLYYSADGTIPHSPPVLARVNGAGVPCPGSQTY